MRENLASKKFVKRGTKSKIVGVLFAIPGTLQLQKKSMKTKQVKEELGSFLGEEMRFENSNDNFTFLLWEIKCFLEI